MHLRKWQAEALTLWGGQENRGIVEVVTGGGKTVFALACIQKLQPETTLVVVPTVALLDQWWEEAAAYFQLKLDEINIITGQARVRPGTINIAVLNTAAKLFGSGRARRCFLIVDECHKAASPQYRSVLDMPMEAALGLSATPERPYDDGLETVLRPALGSIIFRYTYRDALRDAVIVPFVLKNIVFELEQDTQLEYDRLTKAVARSIDRLGIEATETISLLIRRARVLNLSMERVRLALRLVARHADNRILVFHEDIEACNLIFTVLLENKVSAGIYHSKMKVREKADMLAAYRSGQIRVLVTCRSLDEGFNVPETEIGIIAASTASSRQRIQRLGRVLRPASGKVGATIYTLVATKPEIDRLEKEEVDLEGVAEVTWGRA